MRKIITALVPLALLVALIGCEESSPTEPLAELQARFTGTFTPTLVDELGDITRECVIELTTQPAGGRPDYLFDWQIAWVRQATVVEGYPDQSGVVLILPPSFGDGGLFSIRLLVSDRDQKTATASAERRFDCAASEGFTFTGL